MSALGPPSLASIEAIRPVFLIVMGVFLSLIAWRLARNSTTWTARMLMTGALMLGFGYAVLMPLYEAGVIERISSTGHHHGAASTAVACQVVKLVVMNVGWLLFGIGVALHGNILGSPAPRADADDRIGSPQSHTASPHESIA